MDRVRKIGFGFFDLFYLNVVKFLNINDRMNIIGF